MPIQQTSYLLYTPLQDAWGNLNGRVGQINIPLALLRSAQNPRAQFEKVYEDWDERTRNIYDDQGKVVRPLTVRELEDWTTKLRDQEFFVKTLETTYGIRTPSNSGNGKVVVLPDQLITGEVPWLVRIVAGIGAGYLLYRVLRPRRKYA
jgi:hypothetical protein